jgi:hypothetical protein
MLIWTFGWHWWQVLMSLNLSSLIQLLLGYTLLPLLLLLLRKCFVVMTAPLIINVDYSLIEMIDLWLTQYLLKVEWLLVISWFKVFLLRHGSMRVKLRLSLLDVDDLLRQSSLLTESIGTLEVIRVFMLIAVVSGTQQTFRQSAS